MRVRVCDPDDAERLDRLSHRLDSDTVFMMLEPGERTTTVESQRQRLADISRTDDEAMFIAEDCADAVGMLWVSRKPFRKVRHSFYLVIGVVQTHWGKGLGRQLMEKAEDWVASVGGSRIELSVVASNERAIKLYKSCGYEIEGTRRKSMCIGGEFVDEFHMGKLL